ncbi:hypothetical protein HDU87_008159 [Geranomyces variabilis]|uniref:Uncharacterized protein n=1 Tax=Geranomyces variabilis TaxID=109894 RepID=A0AAD5TDK4_9FUNG|nr:hypothetical protein HDU87_008159 [Geranomyces variabilis]
MTRPASTRFELATGGSYFNNPASPALTVPPAILPLAPMSKVPRPHHGHHGGGPGAGNTGGAGGAAGGGGGIATSGGHHAPIPRGGGGGGGGIGGGGGGGGGVAGVDRENGISLQAKQAIIETSPARLSNYDPRDVAVRTEQCYALKDSAAARLVRVQRRADVYRCGFCSDAKDFYKPLGDPVLDSESLVFGTLRIDPNSIQSSADAKIAEDTNELSEVKVSARRQSADTSPRHNNGFEHIKEKLAKSKGRMDAVKFGIPFTQTIDDSAWRHRVDTKNGRPDSQLQEGQVDWHRLKVDTDKQAYFQNVLERELPGFISQKRRKAAKTQQHGSRPTTERWGTLVDKRPRSGRLVTPAQVTDKEAESRSDSNSSLAASTTTGKTLTPKAMELALNIHRDDRINLATDQYYTTREHFYEQRRRLTQVLLDDLNRLDFERKAQFVRKYRNFHIGKNHMFSEDIKAMRKRSDRQRTAEKHQLLQQHPWYTELVTKVVLSGAKKHASEYEDLLLSRVKCVIEDNLPFTQNTFVQLMKVLPAHEFMKDDIQRILRFLKAHGNVTEREFLEAVELAGHMQSL